MFEQSKQAIISDIETTLKTMASSDLLCKLYNAYDGDQYKYTDCLIGKNMLDQFIFDLQGNGNNSVSECAETFEKEYKNVVDNLRFIRKAHEQYGDIDGLFVIYNYMIVDYIPKDTDNVTLYNTTVNIIVNSMTEAKKADVYRRFIQDCITDYTVFGIEPDNDLKALCMLLNHIESLKVIQDIEVKELTKNK